jgi:hypothetical protein
MHVRARAYMCVYLREQILIFILILIKISRLQLNSPSVVLDCAQFK